MQPIILISGGSRGDVQPFIGLGAALQAQGHSVLLVLPPSYAEEARKSDLQFKALRADFDALLGGQSGQNLKNSGRNPFAVMREGRRVMKDVTRTLVEDIWEFTENGQAIVGHIGLSACTQVIAARRVMPLIHVSLQPYMPTGDFSHPLLPLRVSLGKTYNRLTGKLVKHVTWNVFAGEVKRFFNTQDGVEPMTMQWPEYATALDKTPVLNAFSPTLIPFPSDWNSNNHITGFWLRPMPQNWHPSEALTAFLEAGPAPIFIGFGSVSDTVSIQVVQEALHRVGERAILVGFDSTTTELPETIFASPYIPYEWLFPRVKAVIHHGGAGTTAHALRARVPMLPIPQVLDQFFWADRVYKSGVAVKPIAQKNLTVETLASAIKTLTTQQELKARATILGEQIQSEDGLKCAVDIIEKHL